MDESIFLERDTSLREQFTEATRAEEGARHLPVYSEGEN
jgi:hypothetical protein